MNRLFFIAILLLALSTSLYAQRFKGAVMGGMNLTQVDGDEVVGYHRIGGHFGVAAILPLKNWDVTLETVFNQKGAYEGEQYTDSAFGTVITGKYDLRLNYVEIPVLVHYTDRDRVTVGAGFSYGRLVSFEEIEHNGSIPPYSDTVAFKKSDYNVLVDLQVRIWKRLKLNARFAYSLVPVRERTFIDINGIMEPNHRKQYNNILTFRLVYVINEAVPSKIPSGLE